MKPCRIVKSAHAQAQRAGYKGTLKAFVREVIDNTRASSPRLREACTCWVANKRYGSSPARACMFGPMNGPGPTPEQIAITKRNRGQHAVEAAMMSVVLEATDQIAANTAPKSKPKKGSK
jgi:hypothetical protein